MSNRLRLLVVSLFAVACHQETPRVTTPVMPPAQKPVASPYVGCYSIVPPLEFTHTDRVDELRLVDDPVRDVVAASNLSCPDFCSWEEKDGKVIVGLGTGFVGWGLTLSPTAKGLEGVAEFGADVPVDPNPHKVALIRKPCA